MDESSFDINQFSIQEYMELLEANSRNTESQNYITLQIAGIELFDNLNKKENNADENEKDNDNESQVTPTVVTENVVEDDERVKELEERIEEQNKQLEHKDNQIDVLEMIDNENKDILSQLSEEHDELKDTYQQLYLSTISREKYNHLLFQYKELNAQLNLSITEKKELQEKYDKFVGEYTQMLDLKEYDDLKVVLQSGETSDKSKDQPWNWSPVKLGDDLDIKYQFIYGKYKRLKEKYNMVSDTLNNVSKHEEKYLSLKQKYKRMQEENLPEDAQYSILQGKYFDLKDRYDNIHAQYDELANNLTENSIKMVTEDDNQKIVDLEHDNQQLKQALKLSKDKYLRALTKIVEAESTIMPMSFELYDNTHETFCLDCEYRVVSQKTKECFYPIEHRSSILNFGEFIVSPRTECDYGELKVRLCKECYKETKRKNETS